ncbi:hypothetical protein ACFL47_10075 [Candidatus Latescibacterota bacterium]
MNTHGNLTIAPHIHGFDDTENLNPGYRSEFSVFVDFFKFKGFIINSLLGNTTLLSAPDKSQMQMDRIRYTLTPGFRYEFPSYYLKGAIHHECIHTISRPELNGSVWWNSLQIGCGTKGSSYLYLREEYKNVKNSFLNTWDAQINAGYILPANRTLFSGQNHDYKYELFTVIRYHIGSFRKWALFSSLRQNVWMKKDKTLHHQLNVTFNMFRRGTVHFAGIFYNYTIYDSFLLDSTDGLGSVGIKILY